MKPQSHTGFPSHITFFSNYGNTGTTRYLVGLVQAHFEECPDRGKQFPRATAQDDLSRSQDNVPGRQNGITITCNKLTSVDMSSIKTQCVCDLNKQNSVKEKKSDKARIIIIKNDKSRCF